MFNFEILEKYFVDYGGFEDLLGGLLATVQIAVFGLIIGIVIGTLIAVVKIIPQNNKFVKVLNVICNVYVEVFRGTPIVVQLLVFYYALPMLIGVSFPQIPCAIVTFGLNSGAYVSEIMRAGIMSVDKGQMEAARSVGLNFRQGMFSVVLPQAVKNIIPTLGNEFITLIKETSVLSFITVYDLYTALTAIGSKNYEKMVPYLVMAAIYIVLVLLITLLVRLLEQALAKSDKSTPLKKKQA